MFNKPPKIESRLSWPAPDPTPEKITPPVEQIETIPNMESVKAAFVELVKEKSYETTKLKEDADGPYLWEIKIVEPDGSLIEYSYSRAGTLAGTQGPTTKIDVIFSDADGMPSGGYDAASYVNGKWEFRTE